MLQGTLCRSPCPAQPSVPLRRPSCLYVFSLPCVPQWWQNDVKSPADKLTACSNHIRRCHLHWTGLVNCDHPALQFLKGTCVPAALTALLVQYEMLMTVP